MRVVPCKVKLILHPFWVGVLWLLHAPSLHIPKPTSLPRSRWQLAAVTISPVSNCWYLLYFSRLAAVLCWWASNSFTYFLFKLRHFTHTLTLLLLSHPASMFSFLQKPRPALGQLDRPTQSDPELSGAPRSWGNRELVIFKYTPCVTTQNCRTDFVFQFWEDLGRFHWINRGLFWFSFEII
jgi:hypothetical protein